MISPSHLAVAGTADTGDVRCTSRVITAAGLALLSAMAGTATVLAQPETSAPPDTTTTSQPVETTTTMELQEPTTTTSEVAETTSTTTHASTTTETSESTTTTATTTTTTLPDELAITPPADAHLGQADTQTLVASLGEVRVSNAGSPEPRTWTVVVSATDFVNELGDVVPRANVAYASGQALEGTTAQLATPGQPSIDLAVSLADPVVAFAGTGEVGDTVVVWSPTLVLTLPSDVGEGQYDGTIIHSAY